ncbi:hypothetical protein [Primorskyibacter flagellatus]|uniref:hypothetical protein n=1 Tax=Primorskyibacter flagellatus TaxID=1387277 RepID=UPI003A90C896
MNTLDGGNVPRRFAKKSSSTGLEVGRHQTIAKRQPSIVRVLFRTDLLSIGSIEATIDLWKLSISIF